METANVCWLEAPRDERNLPMRAPRARARGECLTLAYFPVQAGERAIPPSWRVSTGADRACPNLNDCLPAPAEPSTS